ncbi:MAG: VCBS repeat-containing protein, partial [Candidatus Omnitrophica bacterium]|nr:VCBS repeat-containing protein [Candidatus Omnitrophota bacterium]
MDIRRGFTFKGKLAVWCLIALHLVMVTPITEILPIKKEVLIPEAEAQIVNTAPVIYSLNGQLLDEIGIASLPTIEEGETFLVEPGIYDPDGDNFNVAFGTIIKILEDLSELPIEASEFSQTGAWQTTLQDQGSYKTALTATDSRGAVSTREVFFSVGDKYEPPSVDVSLSSNSVKAGEAFNITVDLNMPETAAQEGEDEVITEPELPVNYYPSGGVPGDTSENHEITYNGSTRLRTDVKRFGTSSLYVSDYGEGVNVPDSPDWQFGGGDGNFTIDFWFTPNTNHPADQVLFQQCADASNLTGCEILYSSNQVRFLIRVGVSAVVDTYSGPPLGGEFKAGTWYHVAIVRGWNGNANDWACILDGDSTFAATATGNSTTVPDRENDLWVGYGNHSGPGDTYFNGCIDEFRVSDVARWTSDFTPPADCYTDIDQYTKLLLEFDITQDMVTQEEQGGGEVIILPLPVNYYPSEGIPGDASENYEITYNGSTRLRTDVKRFGISSLYVRNPGEGVIVPGSSDWDIGKGDFTIDLWARAKELSGDSANGLCSYTSQGYDGWSIEVVFSGGYSYLAFHYGVGSYMTTIGGPDRVGLAPAVVIDKWYHIAVTKEGTTFRLFINGKLIESREVSATSPPVVDNLIIGGARSLDNQTWNNTYFWNGYIDEVRISKGIARWTSDFTPQVSRYSDIDEYTKLLLEFDIPYDVDEKYLIPTILKDGIPIEDTLGMPQFIYGNCSFDKSYTIQEPGAYEITAVVTDQAGTVSYEDSVHIEVIPEYQDATEKEARKPFSGDFNGDGMTDIGYVDTNTGTWNVCLSEGGSFGVPQTWLRDFGTPSTNVVLTGDFNGDGFTDIACVDPWYQHDGSGIFKIKFSTGSSFDDIYSDEVHSPYTKQVLSGFVDNANQSAMPFTGDFNGDGLTDVGCYINVTYNATHNEGGYKYVSFAKKDPQGGIYFTEFKELIQNFRDCIPIAADFNGDGYTDFCARQDGDGGTWTVIFNNGSDLTTDTTEISDFATGEDTIIGDFNYDGITDLGYFDKDQGKIYYRSFKVESFGQTNVLYFDGLETNTEDDEDLIAMAGDYNGDSILDAATFNKEGLGMDKWTTTLHNSKLPDLLVEIDNGIGATTKIEYEVSTSLENRKLPFPIRVVKKVTKSDGMGNDYVTSYEYKDGYFETDSREFRGFGYVRVSDPEGHYKETYFNQDDTYKGRPNKEVTYDKYNRKIQELDYSWDSTLYHSGKVTFAYLYNKVSTLYDYKSGASKELSTSYEYDEYGNTTKVREEGF